MKSDSRDDVPYSGEQLAVPLSSYQRPRTSDSHSRMTRGDLSPRQIPHHGGRALPAGSSPVASDGRRRTPFDRRVRVVPPIYYDSPSSPRGRTDARSHNMRSVFVVPSSPVLLPPSARLDRIISQFPASSDCNRSPLDDQDDEVSWDAAATTDEHRRSGPLDVILRRRSLVAGVVCVVAYLSPIVMVLVPRRSTVGTDDTLEYTPPVMGKHIIRS